jgi:hypothetical protein
MNFPETPARQALGSPAWREPVTRATSGGNGDDAMQNLRGLGYRLIALEDEAREA